MHVLYNQIKGGEGRGGVPRDNCDCWGGGGHKFTSRVDPENFSMGVRGEGGGCSKAYFR